MANQRTQLVTSYYSSFPGVVMEQLRHIGEVLGSLKALMVFRDEIRINPRQCCLLVDAFSLAFEGIAEEIRQNLRFDERSTKWGALESPLKELYKVFKEGEHYIRQCLETKDWWAKAISLNQNTDCVDFHMHNLLWCIPVVLEAIENVGEITGRDQESISKKRLVFSKKYEQEWMDPNLFQHKFGKHHLVSPDMCSRYDSVWKEDRWILSEMISEKKLSGSHMTKEENQLAELLTAPKGKLFPPSFLIGSKEYHVRRRLGTGSQLKEIQWLGESFALRHFFGDIESYTDEISLLSSISHPNVMHVMYGFSDVERKECFLVMELMNKDLASHIKEICSSRRRVPFSLPVAVDMMLQIARGMEYLHSRKIYHGDLNPSNILVKARNSAPDAYLHIKINGFGISVAKSSSRAATNQPAATNPCIWYAPEVLMEQEQSAYSVASKYTEKADVYSFAMISFELLTGKIPFEDEHLHGENMSRNIRTGERPLFPFQSPKYLTNLTKRCWQAEPSHRPSFSSICRVLRYIKRYLIMNPDHSQPNPPVPTLDYFDLELSWSRRFTTWTMDALKISEIPFQMFTYRGMERERTSLNFREKISSESGSEGASICEDEGLLNMMILEDGFAAPMGSPLAALRSASCRSESNKKFSSRKIDGKGNNKQLGQSPKARLVRPPPQLSTLRARSLRVGSESQLSSVVMSPGRRRISGHASDSEIS